MKLWKQVLSLAAVCGFSATALFGQSDVNQDAVDEMDMQAVKMYVSNKRALFLEDKVNNLNISGDVRFEWQWKDEEHRGGDVIDGAKGNNYIGNNSFDVELNLYVDHVAERTWAKAWLEFDNNAGTQGFCEAATGGASPSAIASGSECETGECKDVCLRQAWFGYNIFEEGTSRLDFEIGRNPLYKLFESRVQFGNTFDGVLMTYSNTFEGVGDFYVKGGLFVIDYHGDQYGWVVEGGLLNIADIGLDMRVSHIDWSMNSDRHAAGSAAKTLCDEVFSFQTTQVSGEFRFDPDMLNVDMKLYGAVLYNWDAKDITSQINGKKDDEPWAWYIGMSVGRLEQEGDWMIDGNYQYVEANAVQQHDVNGVGRGNSRKYCFVNSQAGSASTAGVAAGQGGGNANYMGFQIEGAYALTDNIVISAEFEYSDEAEDDFGGDHEYRKFEVEVLYAF